MKTAAIVTMTSFYTLVLFLLASVVIVYKSPQRWHLMLMLFLGFTVAFVDYHSTEVSFTVLLLLGFGFFLGFIRPRRKLLSALLLAAWVPLTSLVSIGFFYGNTTSVVEGFGSLIAFMPATIGAYLGEFIRSHSDLSTDTDPLTP